MLSTDQAQELLGNDGQVLSTDGDKIGKVSQVFLDDSSGEPAWVTVKTGMFGGAESFVPLDQATMSGNDITVPYDKDTVKDAPRVEDSDGHLEPSEERDLYAYYGLTSTDQQLGTDNAHTESDGLVGVDGQQSAGHDTSGPDTDTAMTRSEERLDVGTTTETVGRARLRKFIVTENVTKTVPVSHEEVRIVREPITDENRGEAMTGGELTEEDHEVELSGERVVVNKETVPVERVQMGTETVTEEQTVNEEVRSERIEAEGDGVHADGNDSELTDSREV